MTEDWPEWRIPPKRSVSVFIEKVRRTYKQRSMMDVKQPCTPTTNAKESGDVTTGAGEVGSELPKAASGPKLTELLTRYGAPMRGLAPQVYELLSESKGLMAGEIATLLALDEKRVRNTLNSLWARRYIRTEVTHVAGIGRRFYYRSGR